MHHLSAQRTLSLLGGMDPSGGAGLLRDMWTCQSIAPEVTLEALCTALTRQGHAPGARAQIRCLPGPEFSAQLAELKREIWKIGMLPPNCVTPLLRHLERGFGPAQLVFDPVLQASAGGQLGAEASSLAPLWAYCTWATPNRQEALALGARPGQGEAPWQLTPAMHQAGAWWIKSVAEIEGAVVDEVHLRGASTPQVYRIYRSRVPGPDPRGTGCALASALASYLTSFVTSFETSQITSHLGSMLEAEGLLDGVEMRVWDGHYWQPCEARSLGAMTRLAPVLAAGAWLARARVQAYRHGAAWHLPLSLGNLGN